MELWTSFILGLAGSLHCAGMCGPLVLAMPAGGSSRANYVLERIAYNLGRITTYGLLGAVFGGVGRSFGLAGLQRWVSVSLGMILLVGLALPSRYGVHPSVVRLVGWIKARFSRLLVHRSFCSKMMLGGLNGLLPCGLVYVACAGAVGTGGIVTGAAYMLVFGFATLPMMLAIGLAGKRVQLAFGFRLQKLIPACVAFIGIMLLLRGLALGIPYLSPDVLSSQPNGSACH